MKTRGRRKKRSPRRARLAAARRATAALAVGALPLHVLIDEGMLSPARRRKRSGSAHQTSSERTSSGCARTRRTGGMDERSGGSVAREFTIDVPASKLAEGEMFADVVRDALLTRFA